jgi:acetyl-CoA decarbonylase/synthase complex subunit gamma
MIAVRSTSDDADKFKACVKKVSETTKLPMVLCALNPQVMEAGLMAAPKARPLLYAATAENWKDMAELAIMYDAPLVASAPNNLDGLMSIAKTLQTYGVKDIVLDPGTFGNEGVQDTINNFTMLRRAATKAGDELAGLPLLGIPMAVWANKGETADDLINGANHTSHPCWLSATQTHSSTRKRRMESTTTRSTAPEHLH